MLNMHIYTPRNQQKTYTRRHIVKMLKQLRAYHSNWNLCHLQLELPNCSWGCSRCLPATIRLAMVPPDLALWHPVTLSLTVARLNQKKRGRSTWRKQRKRGAQAALLFRDSSNTVSLMIVVYFNCRICITWSTPSSIRYIRYFWFDQKPVDNW